MVERDDPGRAGVWAGRVVGVLTAIPVVLTLLRSQDSFYEFFRPLIETLTLGFVPVPAVFWFNVAAAVVSRYAISYMLGSLIGVLYDWLDRPHVAALVPVVLAVGLVDGAFGVLDTRSLAIGGGYFLAWLSYVPAFLWFRNRDIDPEYDRTSPRRLG